MDCIDLYRLCAERGKQRTYCITETNQKLILNYCMVKKNKHGIILCLVIRLFTAATGF